MSELDLTMNERLILFNQYAILRQLSINNDDESGAQEYKNCQTIVLNGYKYDYDQLANGFEVELPEHKAKFVWDVLELYRAIYRVVDSMTPQQREQYGEYKLRFAGFDGNEESDYFAYCDFIVKDMGRYPELCADGRSDFNSHCNVVSCYRQMLEIWTAAGRPYQLSGDLFDTLVNL